jgi:hypothetical protein
MTESIKLGIPGLAVPQGKWCEVACTRGVHEAVVDEYLRVNFDRLKQHPAAESAPVVRAQQHREIRTAENIEPRGDVVVQDRPGFAIRPWPVR